MANLFKGFNELHKFRTLIIKKNELNKAAMQELLPILDRGMSRALIELRLVDCKTTPEVIADMLDFMSMGNFL